MPARSAGSIDILSSVQHGDRSQLSTSHDAGAGQRGARCTTPIADLAQAIVSFETLTPLMQIKAPG